MNPRDILCAVANVANVDPFECVGTRQPILIATVLMLLRMIALFLDLGQPGSQLFEVGISHI